MTIPVPIPTWEAFGRVAIAQSPVDTVFPTTDFNLVQAGVSGWIDLATTPDTSVINRNVNPIFPTYQSGRRSMNQTDPILGARLSEGTLEMPCILELVEPFIQSVLGTKTSTPNAGVAAGTSADWASITVLTTQPAAGGEIIVFTTDGGTATGATLDIIQNAVTVEQIVIPDGVYTNPFTIYSKGVHDGSVNPITFVTAGTFTGMASVTMTGVINQTNSYSVSESSVPVTLFLEQFGLPSGKLVAGAKQSAFYRGSVNPSLSFTFDRTAADGMVTVSTPIQAVFDLFGTPGTYANDAATFFTAMPSWNICVTKDTAAFDKFLGATLDLTGNNNLFSTAVCDQDPQSAYAGPLEMIGSFTLLTEDRQEWLDFSTPTSGNYVITMNNNYGGSLVFKFEELWFETHEELAGDNLFNTETTFRTTEGDTDGAITVDAVSLNVT